MSNRKNQPLELTIAKVVRELNAENRRIVLEVRENGRELQTSIDKLLAAIHRYHRFNSALVERLTGLSDSAYPR